MLDRSRTGSAAGGCEARHCGLRTTHHGAWVPKVRWIVVTLLLTMWLNVDREAGSVGFVTAASSMTLAAVYVCHLLGGGVCIPYILPEYARHVRSVWGFTGT